MIWPLVTILAILRGGFLWMTSGGSDDVVVGSRDVDNDGDGETENQGDCNDAASAINSANGC